MSINTIELVLYEVGTSRRSAEKFKEDRSNFLERYQLTDTEKTMLCESNVGTMRELGASPLLTMGFWLAVEGPREMGDYMRRMKSGGEK